jgi:hypothetical protein
VLPQLVVVVIVLLPLVMVQQQQHCQVVWLKGGKGLAVIIRNALVKN